MTFFAKHHNYSNGIEFKKKINLYLLATILFLFFSPASYAEDINLRLKVTLSQLSNQIKMVQVLCDFSKGKDKAYGSDFIVPKNGGFDGYVNVPVTIHKPVNEYKNIGCEIRLCSSTKKSKTCDRPIAASQLNTLIKPYNTYADNAFNRISAEQPLAESLVILHTPPPSYQMANKSNQNNKQSQKTSESTSSQAPVSLADMASEVNDSGAAAEAGMALAEIVFEKNLTSVTGLVVGLVGLAGSKLLGASDNAVSQILGDLVGLGFTFAGAAIPAAEGAAVAASTTAATTVLPLVAAATTGFGLGTKLDKFLGKKGKTASERIIQPLLPVDNGDTPEFLAAAAAAMARREAEKNAQNEQNNNNTNTGDAQRGQPTTGTNSGVGENVQGQENQELDNTPAPETSPNTTSAPAANEKVEDTPSQKMGTAVIIESRTNSDGSYSYTSMVYENTPDGGKRLVDIIETTCASGTCVSIGENGEQEVHPDNSGGAPENGTTVSVSLGAEDSSSDNEDDSATNDNDGTTDNDSGSNEDGDSSDGGCNEDGSNCDNEDSEQPEEEKEEENPDTKTKENSTPNPNEQDNASDGLAWAMQNPKNPLARQILEKAARAIMENSGYCRLGCSDDTNEGGLLWAMLNPGNPLARTILAKAAESIKNNSGKGQAGGSDDNPAIDLEASTDVTLIEFIISGGGVVDPVEGNEGSAPNIPGSVAPIIGGGSPTAIQNNKLKVQQDLYNQNTVGKKDNEGASGKQEINIDQQNIKSRVR